MNMISENIAPLNPSVAPIDIQQVTALSRQLREEGLNAADLPSFRAHLPLLVNLARQTCQSTEQTLDLMIKNKKTGLPPQPPSATETLLQAFIGNDYSLNDLISFKNKINAIDRHLYDMSRDGEITPDEIGLWFNPYTTIQGIAANHYELSNETESLIYYDIPDAIGTMSSSNFSATFRSPFNYRNLRRTACATNLATDEAIEIGREVIAYNPMTSFMFQDISENIVKNIIPGKTFLLNLAYRATLNGLIHAILHETSSIANLSKEFASAEVYSESDIVNIGTLKKLSGSSREAQFKVLGTEEKRNQWEAQLEHLNQRIGALLTEPRKSLKQPLSFNTLSNTLNPDLREDLNKVMQGIAERPQGISVMQLYKAIKRTLTPEQSFALILAMNSIENDEIHELSVQIIRTSAHLARLETWQANLPQTPPFKTLPSLNALIDMLGPHLEIEQMVDLYQVSQNIAAQSRVITDPLQFYHDVKRVLKPKPAAALLSAITQIKDDDTIEALNELPILLTETLERSESLLRLGKEKFQHQISYTHGYISPDELQPLDNADSIALGAMAIDAAKRGLLQVTHSKLAEKSDLLHFIDPTLGADNMRGMIDQMAAMEQKPDLVSLPRHHSHAMPSTPQLVQSLSQRAI